MKRTQLAAAILLASGFGTNVHAATYAVTPVPLQDTAQNSFAHSIDNSGKMLSTVTLEFNPPVDVEQLVTEDTIFDNSQYPLENEEDVRQGVFSDADYSTIFNYLIATRDSPTGQQLANARSYITDTVDVRLVPGLDEITEKFDDYTQSVVTTARDSLNGDYIVGTTEGVTVEDPYENEDGETINFTYRTSNRQAFVEVNGETKRLAPANDLLGGEGHAYAVNNNLQVAGYGTVSFDDSVMDLIEECEDPEVRGDIPVGFCKSNIYNSPSDFLQGSETNATVWQLDADGDVISLETFPLLFTPEPEDNTPYFTRAYGINNQGVAVGESLTGDIVEVRRPGATVPADEFGRTATVFRNGQTEEILPRDENLQSVANDINDNNWVTGYVLRAISSTARQQLFVHNLNTGETRYPDAFFVGSGVEVNAINNNDIVVGKADFEAGPDTVRESHAFMYNIQSEEFIDLNDLTACDSPYTLVEAVDINDNNEIIANARSTAPQRFISGEEVLGEDGQTVDQDVIISVKLSPRPNGQIDQCEEEDEGYERQGAAVSPWWLLLLSLAGFRRRK